MVEAAVLERVGVAANQKKLNTVITGEPAPRHDKKNLFIKIDIGQEDAIFHCKISENVGKPPKRHVRFEASADCTLYFTTSDVFVEPYGELKKGKWKDFEVSDTTDNVETGYYVEVDEKMPTLAYIGQPKIVVP